MQSPKRGVTHHWVGAEPDPDKYYGFLYIITNNVTGKKYIGRKFYHMYKKRKRIKESNWRSYTGSCKPLNEDIKALGKENFTFEIFKQYIARGNVVYYECNYQHKFDVLTARDENGERLWYNGNIGAIKFIPPEEQSAKHSSKISVAMKGNKNAKGHVQTEEDRAKKAEAHLDKTVYTFYHSQYGTVECTRSSLKEAYDLSETGLSFLINGKRSTHKGWRIK